MKKTCVTLSWLAFFSLQLSPLSAQDGEPMLAGDAQLRARYALPSSHFVQIAGEIIHYADEGKGPALLLVHGSFASLRQWDGWAKQLRREYRVIRFDLSPSGLSGPNPEGDYSVEQRLRVIDGLMNRLKIDRFAIVGTSSGGLPAAAYAATRPDRVRAVILNNIATGPVTFNVDAMPATLKAAVAEDRKHPAYHSEDYWREIMLYNVVDRTKVTSSVVSEWTALNNRTLGDPAIGKSVAKHTSFARTPGDLRAITAPALVLWAAQDHETTLAREGRQTLALLGSKDKTLQVLDNCGHMAILDCPDRALDQTQVFLRRVTRK